MKSQYRSTAVRPHAPAMMARVTRSMRLHHKSEPCSTDFLNNDLWIRKCNMVLVC